MSPDISVEYDFDSIVNSIYIGESFESGTIYIESFNDERSNEETIVDYPEEISFVGLNSFEVYHGKFQKEIRSYIGRIEESTKYYYNPFSEPEQLAGLYKTNSESYITQIGIGLHNYEVESIDKSKHGNQRKYSEEEYSRADKQLKYDASIKSRTLRHITIEDTIIGAKEHFRVKIKNSEVLIIVSEYFTLSSEYAGSVYIVDVISNGEKLGTIEKSNVIGPY